MKDILLKMGGLMAGMAFLVTTMNVNTTCLYMMHQPELPESTKKLKKFN